VTGEAQGREEGVCGRSICILDNGLVFEWASSEASLELVAMRYTSMNIYIYHHNKLLARNIAE